MSKDRIEANKVPIGEQAIKANKVPIEKQVKDLYASVKKSK